MLTVICCSSNAQDKQQNPWDILDRSASSAQPPPVAAAAADRHTAAAAAAKPDISAAVYLDIAAASANLAATPQSAEASEASLSTPQQAAPLTTSYIAEPALLLHPSEPSSGASKLLLVPSQRQDDPQLAAEHAGNHVGSAAAKRGDVGGLCSGSLVWLDDSTAAGSSVQFAGSGISAMNTVDDAAWQRCGSQHQCIITEEGKSIKCLSVDWPSHAAQADDGHAST